MDLSTFHRLHELADEIASTAFWSASVLNSNMVEAIYDNPISGVKSTAIHLHNRDEWPYWRAQIEQKSLPERIKELEQRLAEARALLKYTGRNVWMIPAGTNRLECFGCAHSVDLPDGWSRNGTTREKAIQEAIDRLDHEEVCIVMRIRAFLAQ